MYLCKVFCVLVLAWVSCQTDALQEWHKYIYKTLYECIGMHQNNEDLVTLCGSFTKCYQGTWEERIRAKTLMNKSSSSNHYFVTPYSHIQHSYRGVQSTMIHITVHHIFKLNLTLIRLDIQRSLSGCAHGKLSVSWSTFSLHLNKN